MLLRVKSFKKSFQKQFDSGLPYFLDDSGKLISQQKHHILLVQNHMDHSKFEVLNNGLTKKDICW